MNMLAGGEQAKRERTFVDAAIAEDYETFEQVFVRERAARPYGDTVAMKLAELDDLLDKLRQLAGVTPEVYATDWIMRCAVDRTLELAIGTCIGLARHTVAERGLRAPRTSADTFVILGEAHLLEPEFAASLQRMCGFRNRLVHEPDALDAAIVAGGLGAHVDELTRFGERVRSLAGLAPDGTAHDGDSRH
jgi:uncharacterized protein YutE (UPF0331/DUF86 family)